MADPVSTNSKPPHGFTKVTGTATTAENSQSQYKLGDFTTDSRVIFLSAIAVGIGILGAFVALVLLRLIGLFTNLFFYGRWSTAFVSPAGNRLGPLEIFVPVIGALIVGVMARYGSERIRGHGIPEAIEAILIKASRMKPRIAVLKPLSSAISIGSGGPFGAEGPIIMTGGAFGSLIAQFIRLTSAERKTLLVAGAAAGMSATFDSPVAAVLLSVELLLFEWKPRSAIPVALASAAADVTRRYIIGLGPLFPLSRHAIFIGPKALLGCLIVGILAGALSALLTVSVYAAEDSFMKLPVHWMWWPAIGGVAIGIGGLISPRALGVGYDSIRSILQGDLALHVILSLLVVKWLIWAISLGSGTSGGILAPLLMMGGALGGAIARFLPSEGVGFWPLISMGATLGGTMRSPFTGVIFALELTHDVTMLLPLLVAAIIAHGFTVLTLRRSILTEKIARRGYHLSREYEVDPLEIVFVREVMEANVHVLPAATSLRELAQFLHQPEVQRQRLYPVEDDHHVIIGVLTLGDLQRVLKEHPVKEQERRLLEIVRPDTTRTYPDEPLREAVNQMAETGLTRLLVVQRSDPSKLVGIISLKDVLKARAHRLQDEERREIVIPLHFVFRRGTHRASVESVDSARLETGRLSRTAKRQANTWRRVTDVDCWNGTHDGFNETNAKMVCKRCRREFPFNLKCNNCRSRTLVLDTVMGGQGLFCAVCGHGHWFWDCPHCGRRQAFPDAFFYNGEQLRVRPMGAPRP
jgi:chloride channel protein, CIC family